MSVDCKLQREVHRHTALTEKRRDLLSMIGSALNTSGHNRTNVLEAESPCLRAVESKLMSLTCRMLRPRGSGTLAGLVEAVL